MVTNPYSYRSPSHRLTICDRCLVLRLIARGLSRLEGNGWINWSGLATSLAQIAGVRGLPEAPPGGVAMPQGSGLAN